MVLFRALSRRGRVRRTQGWGEGATRADRMEAPILRTSSRARACLRRELEPLKRDESIIAAINELWTPVYPFMAEYLLGLCGPTPHALLELGPFSGGIALSLLRSEPGCSATVLDESGEVLDWTMERARQDGNSARLLTRQTALPPIPEADTSFDVVAIRGAFFFLTASLLRGVWRVLKPGGLAWVGGFRR